jgi:phosphoribosylformimino-5-aminoimidazole carboxamide ribotide isomerase
VLLIPSIDLLAGRCVRLTQGDFAAETHYRAAPKEILRRYRRLGAPWVHIVDLDGARDGRRINHPVITALAGFLFPHLQVGGGVRTAQDVKALLDAGVARVVVGSAALWRPEEVTGWLNRFGRDRLCLAFDVRTVPGEDPLVSTHGWQTESDVTLWAALKRYPQGALLHVLCTDITRDGTLNGPNFELYRSAFSRFPRLAWQASGGIRGGSDLLALERIGMSAAVSGKALLEERITLEELRPFLPDASYRASTFAPAP